MGISARHALTALLIGTVLSGCTGDAEESPGASPEPDREAEATRCTSTLGAERVAGDLIVPEGATCELVGTAVDGRTYVDRDATLLATSAYLGEGVSAHGFERVELRKGRVESRSRAWRSDYGRNGAKVRDWVFDGGRHLRITDGDINGAYYILQNTGRVEITGFYLDLGVVYCSGNARKPEVRRISAETPGKLQGQCAGLKGFGDSDF